MTEFIGLNLASRRPQNRPHSDHMQASIPTVAEPLQPFTPSTPPSRAKPNPAAITARPTVSRLDALKCSQATPPGFTSDEQKKGTLERKLATRRLSPITSPAPTTKSKPPLAPHVVGGQVVYQSP